MISSGEAGILTALKTDILRMQGFRRVNNNSLDDGLGVIKQSFPNASFPLGCMHEFITTKQEDCAATNGFLAGLLSSLLNNHGVLLWIGTSRKLFPPALSAFGLSAKHFIFIDVAKEKDILWAMDEALKCDALTAVVAEAREISFTESRRFQLAAEKSHVTGFLLRHNPRIINTTACVSRWKITSSPSEAIDDLPGIGNPQWHVQLLKVKNGKPDSWNIQWRDGRFVSKEHKLSLFKEQKRKAG